MKIDGIYLGLAAMIASAALVTWIIVFVALPILFSFHSYVETVIP
jgi:hypothetical protein